MILAVEKSEVPGNITNAALSAVRHQYKAIDPQVMNQPSPLFTREDKWVLTVVDISARILASGFRKFIVTIDKDGKVLKIDASRE